MRKLLLFVLLVGVAGAQEEAPRAKAPRVSRYLSPRVSPLEVLVPQPPAMGSAVERDELAELHRIEAARTPEQVAAAQRDARDASIFSYATVLGLKLQAADLPLTAALSAHLREEAAVVDPALKRAFHRPRPYTTDPTLHTVCERPNSDSYPSGHAMVGYLEGYALAEMVPEQHDAILARSRDFARNRMVCGVHYLSDTEASRVLAAVLFGELLSSPAFTAELAAARKEARGALGFKE